MSSVLFGWVRPRWRGSIHGRSEHALQQAPVAGRFTLQNQPPHGGGCHNPARLCPEGVAHPQGGEGQAGQGRTESGVLAETGMRARECPPGFGTRAMQDADMRRSSPPWPSKLPPQAPSLIAAFASRSASVSGSTGMSLASDGRVCTLVAESQVELSAINVPACLCPSGCLPACLRPEGCAPQGEPHRPLQAARTRASRGRGWGMLGTVRSSRTPPALAARQSATEPRACMCLPAPFRVFAHPGLGGCMSQLACALQGAVSRLLPDVYLSAPTSSDARTRDLADPGPFSTLCLSARTRPLRGRVHHPTPTRIRVHPRHALPPTSAPRRPPAPNPCIQPGSSARKACIHTSQETA
jgi:hypothetical protein